jgi:hypothetical protein
MSFLSGRTSLTTVQAGDIATDAITTAKIAASAVTTAKIAVNNIDSTLTKDALIADYTEVTIATGDSLLLGDVNDSGNTKRDTVQGLLDLVSAGGLTELTQQATTSGTSKSFTIPSGTKLIIINFEKVSLSSAVNIDVRIGDAGGVETTGYFSSCVRIDATPVLTTTTTEFEMDTGDTGTAFVVTGSMYLSLMDAATFSWNCMSTYTEHPSGGSGHVTNGNKKLSAELTTVEISGGTFDAGAINIMYQ